MWRQKQTPEGWMGRGLPARGVERIKAIALPPERLQETFGRAELPQELREVLQGFGYGCLAVESSGVVYVCHAADGVEAQVGRWAGLDRP